MSNVNERALSPLGVSNDSSARFFGAQPLGMSNVNERALSPLGVSNDSSAGGEEIRRGLTLPANSWHS